MSSELYMCFKCANTYFMWYNGYKTTSFVCVPKACMNVSYRSSLRCDWINAWKYGCCNYHFHKQDTGFIDMLLLIRQELGSETMVEATRGSPATGTQDCPASSSFNAGEQQKRPVIHGTQEFLINFQSALLKVPVL